MKKRINKKVQYKGFYMSNRICVLTFCLMLLPLDLLTFINGQVYANSDSMIEYDLNQVEQNSNTITSSDIQKILWQTYITPAEEQQEQVQKDELKSLIEQINAMVTSKPDCRA